MFFNRSVCGEEYKANENGNISWQPARFYLNSGESLTGKGSSWRLTMIQRQKTFTMLVVKTIISTVFHMCLAIKMTLFGSTIVQSMWQINTFSARTVLYAYLNTNSIICFFCIKLLLKNDKCRRSFSIHWIESAFTRAVYFNQLSREIMKHR